MSAAEEGEELLDYEESAEETTPPLASAEADTLADQPKHPEASVLQAKVDSLQVLLTAAQAEISELKVKLAKAVHRGDDYKADLIDLRKERRARTDDLIAATVKDTELRYSLQIANLNNEHLVQLHAAQLRAASEQARFAGHRGAQQIQGNLAVNLASVIRGGQPFCEPLVSDASRSIVIPPPTRSHYLLPPAPPPREEPRGRSRGRKSHSNRSHSRSRSRSLEPYYRGLDTE